MLSTRYWFLSILFLLSACTSIAPVVKNQYTINTYRSKVYPYHLPSLYVSAPEAVASLETEQMLYTKVLYETKPFVHNAWSSTPSDMLYPLLLQSLTHTKAFRVMSTGTHSEAFRYRLNSQILKLEQNFITKPSHLWMMVSVTISDSMAGKPIASKIFQYHIPCLYESPYGGAIAANRASAQLTYDVSHFTVMTILNHKSM